jgi:hypothetical protein
MTPQVPAIRALRASVGIVSSGAPHPVADARVSITATAETLAPGRSEKMEITTVPGRVLAVTRSHSQRQQGAALNFGLARPQIDQI